MHIAAFQENSVRLPKIVTCLLFCAALAGAPHLSTLAQTAPGVGKITPIRPPAVPLIVRSPYISTWQPGSALAGTWPAFWTGGIKAITGVARVDGVSHVMMGSPGGNYGAPMSQVSLIITPTRSVYLFQGGGVSVGTGFSLAGRTERSAPAFYALRLYSCVRVQRGR